MLEGCWGFCEGNKLLEDRARLYICGTKLTFTRRCVYGCHVFLCDSSEHIKLIEL